MGQEARGRSRNATLRPGFAPVHPAVHYIDSISSKL
jgi:hypothetical protein